MRRWRVQAIARIESKVDRVITAESSSGAVAVVVTEMRDDLPAAPEGFEWSVVYVHADGTIDDEDGPRGVLP